MINDEIMLQKRKKSICLDNLSATFDPVVFSKLDVLLVSINWH